LAQFDSEVEHALPDQQYVVFLIPFATNVIWPLMQINARWNATGYTRASPLHLRGRANRLPGSWRVLAIPADDFGDCANANPCARRKSLP